MRYDPAKMNIEKTFFIEDGYCKTFFIIEKSKLSENRIDYHKKHLLNIFLPRLMTSR